MNRTFVGILAAVAVVGVAPAVEAQVCAGFPSSQRGFYFGGRMDFPGGDETSLGVEAAYNAAGPLAVHGGLNVLSHDGHSDNQFRAGASFEIAQLGAMFGPSVSVCPTAEARWITEDGATYMEIPLGLGFGADLGAPAGPAISAYAIPQFVIARLSGEGFDTVSDNNFGITGGAMVGFGQIMVGGEVRHIFVSGADPVFGIRVGLRF
jgi:hypothetical protein